MTEAFSLVRPKHLPPLETDFRPAVLANRAFQAAAAREGVPLVLGLERNSGRMTRFETRVFPEDHPQSAQNFFYAERLLKFLLWQRGSFRVYVGGPRAIANSLRAAYTSSGPRRFDAHFMGELVYEQPFEILGCTPDQVPAEYETGTPLGRHLNGCRIGFDLGASDRKVSAVVDGQVIFSEEVVWEPRRHADPLYHYQEISAALRSAAEKMPRVDAIGGSSAGIYIDNRPMVASLFRCVPPERYGEVRDLFLRLQRELGVPLEVINDGDVTALAGSMALGEGGVLGIAMGSSQAAGYVDLNGHLLGWLNELAFAPVDFNPAAAVDEWSGDMGCGSTWFSQQCVFRLAPRAGIAVPAGISDAERLKFVQEMLEAGHQGARQIWESMGIALGYALAQYSEFYPIRHVLLLGRCTSGSGGTLILEHARMVLESEFPELAAAIKVQLPDEKSRRVGQSIAAASLPITSN